MSSAIERLAAQLLKLSNEEWARATERWVAGHDWQGVFGLARDEISERLCEIDRKTGVRRCANEAQNETPIDRESHHEMAGRGNENA